MNEKQKQIEEEITFITFNPAQWKPKPDPVVVARDTLVHELTGGKVTDLAKSFDLTAFPLPMRVAMWDHKATHCWTCQRNAVHIYMKVQPRTAQELFMIQRDDHGRIELNTCTFVTQAKLDEIGPAKSIEMIRDAIHNMVMHEMYEALMFRGMRIMDPHHGVLRPGHQPF